MLQSMGLKTLLILGVVVLCSFNTTFAQSTVFNIPSTEVLSRGEGYFEADFQAHLSSYESGGYHSYGPRVVYGLGKRTEIGLNAFYTHAEPTEPIELQPNFKWKFLEGDETGVAAATGIMLFIPVTQRTSSTTHGQIYAVVSKTFKGSHGPSFTVGGYGLVGSFEEGTTKQGVLLGYEQPINKKFIFQADWSSGNNDLGYVATGVGITLTTKTVLYVGYNIGNQGRGNNSINVSYGISF